MHFRKRILSFFLCLTLLSGLLAACTAQPEQPDPTTVPTTAPVPTTVPTEAPTQPTTEPTTEPTEAPTEPIVWPDEPWLYGGHGFVYDCKTQEYRFVMGGLLDPIYPASITKLFNAYVGLQYLDDLDQVLTVGGEVWMIAKGASKIGLQPGDQIKVRELLKAMLIPSGCDSAYVMATTVGRILADDPELYYEDAVALYVEEMNRQAELLGLENTHIVTPDGRHKDDHYICMGDFTKIAVACLDVQPILDTVKLYEATITLEDGTTFEVENTNVHIDPDSPYYIPECFGLKTGSHYAAGYCLIAAFHVDDRDIIMGIFGAYDDVSRAKDIYTLWENYGRIPKPAPVEEIPEDTTEPTAD